MVHDLAVDGGGEFRRRLTAIDADRVFATYGQPAATAAPGEMLELIRVDLAIKVRA
ncbi:MAG: hypothetical protein ACRD1F_03185 [Terriglobales bacterium]